MQELELTRAPGDRTLFELAGIGSLRAKGWFGAGSAATVTAGGVTWECRSSGLLRRRQVATDKAGTVDGTFVGGLFGSGSGTIEWEGQPFSLARMGFWRPRFQLRREDELLCEIQPRGKRRRPLVLRLHADPIPGGALMFAVYVVRDWARQQESAGGGAG